MKIRCISESEEDTNGTMVGFVMESPLSDEVLQALRPRFALFAFEQHEDVLRVRHSTVAAVIKGLPEKINIEIAKIIADFAARRLKAEEERRNYLEMLEREAGIPLRSHAPRRRPKRALDLALTSSPSEIEMED